MAKPAAPATNSDVDNVRLLHPSTEESDWGRDRELMRAVAEGDPVARRDLARRLVPRVRRTVRAVLGPHDELEDATQVCLMEVLRAVPNYRGDSSIETWSRRIVVRRAMRFVRRTRLMSVVDQEADPAAIEAPLTQSPLAESLPRPLDAYLDALPEIHRVALVLRHGFGYSLKEIADMTETATNTVKMRLFHGLRKLRRLIEEDLEALGEQK